MLEDDRGPEGSHVSEDHARAIKLLPSGKCE